MLGALYANETESKKYGNFSSKLTFAYALFFVFFKQKKRKSYLRGGGGVEKAFSRRTLFANTLFTEKKKEKNAKPGGLTCDRLGCRQISTRPHY